VGIQSVSAWPKNRGEIDRVVEWTAYLLMTLSSEIELVDVGQQILPSGQIIHLPKVLLGTLEKDASNLFLYPAEGIEILVRSFANRS